MNFIGSSCESLSKRDHRFGWFIECRTCWQGLWLAAFDLQDSGTFGDISKNRTRMAVTAGPLPWSECYLPDVYGRYRSRAQRST
jgi:hypothetical protein